MSEIQKISEMINNLQEIILKEGDLPLVYSKDDEGNGFDYIYYSPTVGTYDGKRSGEFRGDFDPEEDDDEFGAYENKVVCIN